MTNQLTCLKSNFTRITSYNFQTGQCCNQFGTCIITSYAFCVYNNNTNRISYYNGDNTLWYIFLLLIIF